MENNINEKEVVVEETTPVEQPAEQEAVENAAPVVDETPVVEAPVEAPAEETPAAKENVIDKVVNTVKNFDYDGLVNKISNFFKTAEKATLIKIGCIALAAVIVIVAGGIGISVLGNNYTTPVKTMQKNANNIPKDPFSASLAATNGVLKGEIKDIISIVKSTEEYEDMVDDYKDSREERIESLEDEYGKNWKVKYKIEDKEKLKKSDLRDFKDTLQSAGESLADTMDEMLDDYDSDDWEDAGDELGLSKSEMKELAKNMKAFGKALKKVDVTAGYELEVVIVYTGSELDEPEEVETTINVYKVNGRWVTENAITSFMYSAF